MKKIITLIVTVVLSTLAIFGLTACGGNADSSQYLDTKTKTITVGITNAAPMNYKNADGKWIGFDTELTVTLFNALGYKVMFKEIEWANKYIELESGTINCIWNGFTANSKDKDTQGQEKDRKDIVNMSMNYMINEQCVIKNKSVTFIDETSFNGKTIAYEVGSSGDAGLGYILEDYPSLNVNKKGATSQSKALQEVNAGTADFAIIDKSLADTATAAGSGYGNVDIVSNFEYFDKEYYAIGFNKTEAGAALRDKVDILLKAFYSTGYLKELAEKYSIDYDSRIVECFTR